MCCIHCHTVDRAKTGNFGISLRNFRFPSFPTDEMLRRFSSWIPSSGKSKPTTSVDVEALFLDNRVQSLLQKLTGLSAAKVFRHREYSGKPERPTYRLMTKEEFDEVSGTLLISSLFFWESAVFGFLLNSPYLIFRSNVK